MVKVDGTQKGNQDMEVVGHIIVTDPKSIVLVDGQFLPKGHYQIATGACDCMNDDLEDIERILKGEEA